MPNNKKHSIHFDWFFFFFLLSLVTVMMFGLFYRQSMGSESYYPSDVKAYILEMQGLESGYEFPYPVLFWLSAFLDLFVSPPIAVALVVTVLNAFAMVIVKYYMNQLFCKSETASSSGNKALGGIACSVATFFLFYVSMLFPPGAYQPGVDQYYVGVFTPNPFHNATYLAARPFAIVTFIIFIKVLSTYEQGIRKCWKQELLLGISLLLATMTKPSFTLIFLGAAGLVLLFRLLRGGFAILPATLQLVLFFIPTFAHLLYQFQGVFVPSPGEVGGIGFSLAEVWLHHSNNIPVAILKAICFPLLVVIFNRKVAQKRESTRFAWLLYLVSLAMFLFLYEKGFRKYDMNFSWGYMCGLFFLFLDSILLLIEQTIAIKPLIGSCKKNAQRFIKKELRCVLMLVLQWMVFFWHLICGILYFMGIYSGVMYY
ncbi:MAG: hypothetical protein LBM69_02270 [Lachnospiraceae bacterium]|jgi:hypothetical protein|nr:hypothetical protein [Lachnospiraceae bacterium]